MDSFNTLQEVDNLQIEDTNTFLERIDDISILKPITCEPEECLSAISKPCAYLKILQQNIRSINKNFDSLCILLSRININCDLIVLSECWLSVTNNLPGLEGFSCFKTTDNYNQNDGVVVYVRHGLKFSVEEPQIVEGNCLMIKINTDTVILAIYRPYGFTEVDKFITSLSLILNKLLTYKNIVIVGDINIDIRKSTPNSTMYLDMLLCSGLIPTHYERTRALCCYDHVILKSKLITYTFILQTAITDHDAVFMCMKLNNSNLYNKNKYSYKINFDNLLQDSKTIKFDKILQSTNLNEATNLFIQYIQGVVARNTLTYKLPRNRITIKPWITVGLLRCIRNRDRMHAKLKKEPNNTVLCVTYKRYRNYCNTITRSCKRTYEKQELLQAKHNTKKLWKTIKNVTNLNKPNDTPHELLRDGSNPELSINNVNNFFATIGSELAHKISVRQGQENFTCTSYNQGSFVLLNTTEAEIESVILNLKSDCSVGWDGISAKGLKAIKDVVVPPLTYLINSSLSTGVFPDALKKSLVIPIYKAGRRNCVNNYRPISILTTISKVFEKIINVRLINYLESKKILSCAQFGFRKRKSTDDAIHEYVNFIVNKLDNKEKCLTIFLDLAKAFDTVSLSILSRKLEAMGIRGTQLQLFESYITNRLQSTKIGDITSDEAAVSYGVPQGSILGPSLFLCYINDLCQLPLEHCKIISYADDTTLTFYADTWEKVFKFAQKGFNTVCRWLASNYLTLNADKTNFITYTMRNYRIESEFNITAHSCSSFDNLYCTCPNLKQINSTKYLGIIIDNNLTFDEHIRYVVKKIRKLTYVFKQLRLVADKKLIKTVYIALCQSVLSYCVSSWGGSAKTFLLELERAQRLILKISQFKPRLYPTDVLFRESEVLSVRQLYILATIIRQHRQIHYSVDQTQSSSRRQYMVCPTSSVRTSYAHKFFRFQAGRLYNHANKALNIYPLNYVQCKKAVTTWLIGMNYEQTENLLTVIQ